MTLKTNRQAGDTIESGDINLIASTVNDFSNQVTNVYAKADQAVSTADAAYAYNQSLVAPAADIVNAVLADDASDARQTLARVAPVYDLTATGTVSDAVNVIAVAERIAPTGRKIIRLAPGHYDFSDVTVAKIKGLYLVGDGVTVTRTSYVYPFTTAEWAGASVEQTRGTGGRGRVAFELDDGVTDHWQHIFPLTKELGITLGSAWHTGSESPWITEAHRHGWEIISHLPENITAVQYYDEGRLDQIAVETLDRIEEMIGTRDGIGFVYPQHVRNDETDRVLSKYFTRGRGLANLMPYTPGLPNPWLTSSYPIDNHLSTGGVTDRLREVVRQIANNNSSLVLYFHYQAGEGQAKKDGLRALVSLLRSEGVEIVNPGQIVGDHNIIGDRFFESPTDWATSSAVSFDTSSTYHGSRAIKMPGATGGNGSVTMVRRSLVPTMPGRFTVFRASVRRRSTAAVTVTSEGQGLYFSASMGLRDRTSGETFQSLTPASRSRPHSGTTLDSTAGAWVRESELIYLPPSVNSAAFGVHLQNVLAGSGDTWFDDFQVIHVDYVTSVTYRVRLFGTGNALCRTSVPLAASNTVTIRPVDPIKGSVTIKGGSTVTLILTSTSAEDVGEVDVTISPKDSSYADEPSPLGA